MKKLKLLNEADLVREISTFRIVEASETLPQKGYKSPPGFHRHRCEICKCIWEHSDASFAVAGAHLCPQCKGDWQLYHYRGPKKPTVVNGEKI